MLIILLLPLTLIHESNIMPNQVGVYSGSFKQAVELSENMLPLAKKITGQFFSNVPSGTMASSNISYVFDNLYAMPLIHTGRCTYNQISIRPAVGVGGALAYVGIYDCGNDGRPLNLLYSVGPIDTAAAGIKDIALNMELRSGTYFVGFTTNFTQQYVSINRSTLWNSLGQPTSISIVSDTHIYIARPFAALPAIFPAGHTIGSSTGQLFYSLRKA